MTTSKIIPGSRVRLNTNILSVIDTSWQTDYENEAFGLSNRKWTCKSLCVCAWKFLTCDSTGACCPISLLITFCNDCAIEVREWRISMLYSESVKKTSHSHEPTIFYKVRVRCFGHSGCDLTKLYGWVLISYGWRVRASHNLMCKYKCL